jgi:hypothetical protein
MLWTDEVFLRLLAFGAIGIALGEWGHSWWKGMKAMKELREGRIPTTRG